MGQGDDDESSGAAADESTASSGLLRVVWFRQMVHRWQSSSSGSASADADADEGASPDAAGSTGGPDGGSNDAMAGAGDSVVDSDRNPQLLPADRPRRMPGVVVVVPERGSTTGRRPEGESSPMTPDDGAAPPADVPRGCVPVYVGAERRRFVVPTAYLGMPVFRRLLEKAEEEFEFQYSGGAVTIPCDTEAFKYILLVMDRHRQGLVDDEGNAKDGEQCASPSSSQTR